MNELWLEIIFFPSIFKSLKGIANLGVVWKVFCSWCPRGSYVSLDKYIKYSETEESIPKGTLINVSKALDGISFILPMSL